MVTAVVATYLASSATVVAPQVLTQAECRVVASAVPHLLLLLDVMDLVVCG